MKKYQLILLLRCQILSGIEVSILIAFKEESGHQVLNGVSAIAMIAINKNTVS